LIKRFLYLFLASALFFIGCDDEETGNVKVVNNSVYQRIKQVEIRSEEHGIVVNQEVSISNGSNRLFRNLSPAENYKVTLVDGDGGNYTTDEFGLDAGQTVIVTYYYRADNSNADKYGVEYRGGR